MTRGDRRLSPTALLGLEAPDVGCDVCFELLDEYVEAMAAGANAAAAFPGMAQHLVCCPACDEEAASLAALLDWSPPIGPPAV
jgi:hypothetical protein